MKALMIDFRYFYRYETSDSTGHCPGGEETLDRNQISGEQFIGVSGESPCMDDVNCTKSPWMAGIGQVAGGPLDGVLRHGVRSRRAESAPSVFLLAMQPVVQRTCRRCPAGETSSAGAAAPVMPAGGCARSIGDLRRPRQGWR